MKKRILSLLLAFLMVVSILPAPAHATDSTDVTITPSETTTETATEAACPTCGTVGCTSEHLAWCPDCKVDDCGKTHVYCETCQVNDCGVDHSALQPCVTCGSTECDGAHDNWCADCKTDNCGKAHVYCETCQKNDCGADHNATEPTEAATEPVAAISEEETTDPMVGKLVKPTTFYFAQAYSDINNLSDSKIVASSYYPELLVITDVAVVGSTTYYQLSAAEGYAWPSVGIDAGLTDGYWLDSTKLEVIEEKEPCDICGEYDCTTEHKQCDACGEYDCGKTHVWCETCGKYDCGIEHEDATPSISATVTDADGNEQTVTVSGDALPEGATLRVTESDAASAKDKFGLSHTIFAYDITVIDENAFQWQPDAAVLVKIPVAAAAGTLIGLLHTHDGAPSYIGMTEVLSDGTVEFYTDGFSEFAGFTVDFHYNGVEFSIEGLTSILLSELFAAMGIEEDATQSSSVVFSDNDLVGVEQQPDGDWLLTSLDAFSTEETLIITFYDGATIVIDVTDDFRVSIFDNSKTGCDISVYTSAAVQATNNSDYYIYSASAPGTGRTLLDKETRVKTYATPGSNSTLGVAEQTKYWFYVSGNSNTEVAYDGLYSVSVNGNAFATDEFYIDRISTEILDKSEVYIRQKGFMSNSYEQRTVKVYINGSLKYTTPTYFPINTNQASSQIVVTAGNGYVSKGYSYDSSTKVYTVNLVSLHTVTWVNWDESVLETDSNVEYGTTPAYNSATPTKAATAEYTYTFAGWSPAVSTVTGDVTYTATYTATKNKYTITWKNYDGTVIDTTSVAYGDVPTHTNPTKAATAEYTYTFAGWTPTVAAVTGNATYTATYTATKNKYTVTVIYDDGQVDANGLDGYTQTDGKYQKLVEYNSVIALEFEPKTGYQITEVKLGSDTIGTFTGTINQPITSHTTITVTSSPITYTVKYDGNPTSYGTTSDSTHTYGVAKSLTANGYDRSGYKFVGWNTEANGSGTSYADQESVTNLSDTNGAIVTLYAQWLPIYKITLDSQNQTTEADNFYFVYTQNTYYSDNVCTTALTDNKIELPSKNGYSFAGYYTGTNGSGTQYIDKDGNINSDCCQLNADTTLYAKWDIITYTITYQYNDGVTPDSTVNYNYETSIQLQVPERLGYKFLGWTNLSMGESTNNWKYTNYNYTTGGMESPGNHQYGNVILIARWEIITYAITYNLDGGTASTANPETYTVETETFTLYNPTKAGYEFLGWATSAEASTGTDPLKIEKGTTGNLTYYAIWKRALVDLTITATTDDTDQNFIFTVSGIRSDGMAFEPIDVVLCSENDFTVTIKDLPVGEYTVTEKDGWSWREKKVDSQQVSLTTESKEVAFAFGAVDRIYWLSDYSYKRKKGGS